MKQRNHLRHQASRSNSRCRAIIFCAFTAVVAMAVVFVPAPAFADETRDQQWYLDALQIGKVHELSQGEGVTVGVIDSGIDADHPDLEGNIEAGKSYGSSTGDGLEDSTGHGTSVSSLIVGHGHGKDNSDGILGIAPKAKVISVSVDATVEANYDIADAIRWLVDQKVDIISVSMSAEPTDSSSPVSYADKKGVQVVASAGNVEPDPYFGENDNMGWPAYGSGAMPVSGTDKNGEFWDGSVDLKSASPQPKLGVSAPATDLITAKKGGGYETHDGTSGSAPLVAGTLALIKSAYPELSYESYTDRLLDTVDDKGPKGYDDKYGSGVINPYRALTEETVFESRKGPVVSSPDDRLPLAEQGNKTSDEQNEKKDKGSTLTASSFSITLPIALVAGAITLAVIVTVLLVAIRRTKQKAASP